jgi:exportin-7
MLKAALCGNYVNFGVFRLYGDNALDKAFGMFVKLLLSVSQRDLMVRNRNFTLTHNRKQLKL